jgi:uncharacterized protein (DUF885 family)
MADDDDRKTEKSDDSKKAAKSDDSQKTGKGAHSEETLKDERQKSFDAGTAKGAKKGSQEERERILKDLGFEDLDAAKAALEKGTKALEKLDTTKSKGEKAIEALKAEFEERERKLRDKWEPVFEEAQKHNREHEEAEIFKKLNIVDPETTRAYMALHEAKDGESYEDHVKRILEKKPDLADKSKARIPSKNLNVGDKEDEPADRHKVLGKKMRGYYGSKRLDRIAAEEE